MNVHMPVPINDRPPVQRSAVVANVLNLRKNSVQLIRSSPTSSVYSLNFVFDAQVGGFVSVYFRAQQVIRRSEASQSPDAPILELSYVTKDEAVSKKFPFVSGEAQQFHQQLEDSLDVRRYKSAELQRADSDYYPIVIQLEANYPKNSTVPIQERVKSQTTFATLVPKNGSYIVNIVAQQVLVNGTLYKILNLYGIGSKNAAETKNSNDPYAVDSTDECVVCLTEPCDTACEPCNHLCLCEDCARTLWAQADRSRRRCPVCRSEFVKLLRIIPAQNSTPSPTTALPPKESVHTVEHTSPQTRVQELPTMPI